MRTLIRALVTAALVGAAALVAGGLGACASPTMDPGKPCGSCHGSSAPAFGAAGTLFTDPRADVDDGLEGATIDLVDADGRRVTMRSNEAGNFFTRQGLTPPLQVTVTSSGATAIMAAAPSGDCNACHRVEGVAGSRIHVP